MNNAPDGFQWVTIELSLKDHLSETVTLPENAPVVVLDGEAGRVSPVFTLQGEGEIAVTMLDDGVRTR